MRSVASALNKPVFAIVRLCHLSKLRNQESEDSLSVVSFGRFLQRNGNRRMRASDLRNMGSAMQIFYCLLVTLSILFQWGCQNATPRISQPAKPAYEEKQTLGTLPNRRLNSLLPPHGVNNQAFNKNRVVLTGTETPVPRRKLPVYYASHMKQQPGYETAAIRTGSPPLSKSSSTQRQHRVQRGETLYQLSRRFYGDGNQWQIIARANPLLESNPTRLRAGMVLVIP